jgi:NAD(P)-dependent dehydrogenase (short-subunit alcohol dehydrogenase family)
VDELRFDGRVAIITGAGSLGGMGEAHAKMLASRGAKVVVNDIARDGESGAQRVADEINAGGGSAVANADDVSLASTGARLVGTALETYGRVDIVINNAGTASQAYFPDVETFDAFAQAFAVHLGGAFNLIRAAWPHFVSATYGRVINITSSALLGNSADMSYITDTVGNLGVSYPTMKAGMIGLTKTLANFGAEHGITVNAVAPAATTQMGPHNVTRLSDGSEVPLEPSLVSAGIAVLAHERCPVNGEILGMGGSKVDRLFVGATQGYLDVDLTPERLVANWEHVMVLDDFWIPENTKAHADRLRQDRAALLPSSRSGPA